MGNAVNLRKADRRDLDFESVDDALEDLQRILSAERLGELRTSGNWSAGQIFQHVGRFIRYSYDGFPFSSPLPIRLASRLLKPVILGDRPFPVGVGLRGDSAALLPDAVVATQEGVEELRTQLHRIKSGEKMTAKSPALGPLTHDQWLTLHLKHAAHHFSYLHPENHEDE